MPGITVVIDSNVYRLSAVKKAAYRLGGRCFAQIGLLPEGGILVRLEAKSEDVPLDMLEGDFWNELLDQDLRETIAQETERVRNLLLAQAFSEVSLTDARADTADYYHGKEDPQSLE